MSYYNPMLIELQKKIRNYNKDIKKKIDDVARRQNIITAITVPISSFFGKKQFNELELNANNLKPSMNYAGEWEFRTDFGIQSPNEGH